MGPYKSISHIKSANKHAGKYFFTEDAMAFFDSRIESKVPINGRYFITSEQFHGSDSYDYKTHKTIPAYHGPRFYTIRRANDDGSIDTVGEFGQEHGYETFEHALAVARELPTEPYVCWVCGRYTWSWLGSAWYKPDVCKYCHEHDEPQG